MNCIVESHHCITPFSVLQVTVRTDKTYYYHQQTRCILFARAVTQESCVVSTIVRSCARRREISTRARFTRRLRNWRPPGTCATEVCRETSRCHAQAHSLLLLFFFVAALAVPYERHLANASAGRHTRSCSRVRATDYAVHKRTLHVDMRIPIYPYLRGLHFTG